MTKKFKLTGLDCANCAAKIEKDVVALDGVINASVNHMTEKLIIEAEEGKMENIVIAAEKIVKKYEPHVAVTKA